MKNILAFGDSNTWGLIPGTKERFSGESDGQVWFRRVYPMPEL